MKEENTRKLHLKLLYMLLNDLDMYLIISILYQESKTGILIALTSLLLFLSLWNRRRDTLTLSLFYLAFFIYMTKYSGNISFNIGWIAARTIIEKIGQKIAHMKNNKYINDYSKRYFRDLDVLFMIKLFVILINPYNEIPPGTVKMMVYLDCIYFYYMVKHAKN